MILTSRRKQFLEQLMDLYERSSLPVHYEALAKTIGVSKWTAYDMVKQLEKMKLLKKEYVVNKSETGRSLVVYSPTEEAYLILKKASDGDISEEEWEQTAEELLKILKKSDSGNPNLIFQQILDKMPSIKNKTVLAAYVVALFVIYAKYTNKTKLENIIQLLNHVGKDITKITIFAGAVVGLFLKDTPKHVSIEVMNLASEHMNSVERLPREAQKKIASFLITALSVS